MEDIESRHGGPSAAGHPGPHASAPPDYRWAVLLYDRVYRWLHGLHRPGSEVGPVLRVEIRRNRRLRVLADGTRVSPGDRIGILHLNNERIATLHVNGRSPLAVGLEFRRQFVASLRVLATLAAPGGPFQDVEAFAATTIFHDGMTRIGFVPEPGAPSWPRAVAAYQRALLASTHPAGALRLSGTVYRHARRLWLPRRVLLHRYGAQVSAPGP